MASTVKDKSNSVVEVGHLIGGEIKYYDGPTQAVYNPSNGEVSKQIQLAKKETVREAIEIAQNVSDFRIFRTQLRNAFAQFNASFVFIDVLLTWGTNNFSAIKVQHYPRKFGKSNYSFIRLVNHAIDMMTGFSVFPLRIASILGLGFSLFGLLVLIFIIVEFLTYGSQVKGFPFLASIIAIFSGVQLLTIGFIGEYLARLYFRSMDKPTYTIRSFTKNQIDENPI